MNGHPCPWLVLDFKPWLGFTSDAELALGI
jgi:hypothetical protein